MKPFCHLSRQLALGIALVIAAPGAWVQGAGKPAAAAAATKPSATVSANASTSTPSFVRELGGIQEWRLPNGLQVLLLPDAAQTTTTVNFTYRMGSRHEAPGVNY